MRKVMTAVLGVVLAQAAWAEEDALAKAMARNPDRFEAQATDLIAGFGGPQDLTAEGVETHIALQRAGARASAMRRFLAMDLDGDGSVTRAELAVTQAAVSAQGRGRMERLFLAADANGDDTVAAEEIAAAGVAAGLAALDDGEAALLRAMLTLDADGNGALTGAEVAAAVKRAGQAG